MSDNNYNAALGMVMRSGETARNAREILRIARERGRADFPGGIAKFHADVKWGPNASIHSDLYEAMLVNSIDRTSAFKVLTQVMPALQATADLNSLADSGIGNAYVDYTLEFREGRDKWSETYHMYYAGQVDGSLVFRSTRVA